MKLIQEFADLAEIIGGRCPDIGENDPEHEKSPTYRATDPNAWDYDD
jgi:hypothetical protein